MSVFVDEAVASGGFHDTQVGRADDGRRREWGSLVKGAMGPVFVVVLDVVDDEPFELAVVPDDGAVEEFAAY